MEVSKDDLLKRENEIKEADLDLEKIINHYQKRGTNNAGYLPKNIKEKLEYITQELDLDKKVFEKFPALFSYSMSKRIWPRLELIREKGLNFNNKMMSSTEDSFLHQYEIEKYQLDSKIDQFEDSVYAKKL